MCACHGDSFGAERCESLNYPPWVIRGLVLINPRRACREELELSNKTKEQERSEESWRAASPAAMQGLAVWKEFGG